tara:strand:- start:4325 stop:5089 length:765 start_codon:yes stop_codon:yes gene_type:complete
MKKLSFYYKKIIFHIKKKIDLDKIPKDEKSLNELFNHFGTDKGTSVKNPYNKKSEEIFGHGFAEFYEKYFNNFKNDNINFLEIGTWEGASLASFTKYFNNANLYGLDRNFKFKYKSKRINFHYCDTTNNKDLKKISNKIGKSKFKVIIDDGSHLLNDIIHNLKFFLDFVDNNGYYVIEDYNHPEYYSNLNNSLGDELLIKDIIIKIKNKQFFDSKILNRSDQLKIFESIKEINVHKGIMIDGGTNVSDIVFFKK